MKVKKIRRYFMLAGGIIVALTIIISLLSSLYSEYAFCRQFKSDMIEDEQNRAIEGATTAEVQYEYLKNLETKIRCSTVDGNIYTSYIAIIIGLSLLIGGFIIRD